MTNGTILAVAMAQSSIDSNCTAKDFLRAKNTVVISTKNPAARKYLELPFLCDFTSYGNNIVASVSPELQEMVEEYLAQFSVEHCFETPNLHVFMEKLNAFNLNVCFMAEYFLPNRNTMKPLLCAYETKLLKPCDFEELYLPLWGNALCKKRKHLDKLALGAFDKGQLIGLAGSSADCDSMWQIGIDVLPAYRQQGIGASLTNQLALTLLSQNIVPFYCCSWANIRSARNAIASGFAPAWVQMTVKTNAFINTLNAAE